MYKHFKFISKIVLLIIPITIYLLPNYGIAQPQGWTSETVDGFLSAYQPISDSRLAGVAFDSLNNLHISYYTDEGSPRNRIKHAVWNGTVWSKETVDSMYATIGIRNIPNSIAINNKNEIHIAYRNVLNSERNMKHALWNGDEWTLDFIDPVSFPNFNGGWNAITTDSKGNPHVAYSDDSNGILRYAYWNGSTWVKEIIKMAIGSKSAGEFVSIVLDDFDYPHLVYHEKTGTYSDALIYNHFDGNFWIRKIIDDRNTWYPSIKLTKNGMPRIAYHLTSEGTLNFASYNGSSWDISVLDGSTSTRVGKWCSLDLDRLDRPHISYYDEKNEVLKYAFFNDASWQIQTIDNLGSNGQNSYIGLNYNDDPFIVYTRRDVNNEAVKVARPADYGPNPFSLMFPENGSYQTTTPTFDWESSSFIGKDISHYELWIDQSLYKGNLPSNFCTVTIDQPLSGGLHTWRIRAVLDNGGEIWSNETWSIRIDSTPPQAFNLLNPTDEEWVANSQPEFTWQASSDAGSGLKEYQLFVDNEINVDNILPATTSVNSSLILPDGIHSWYVVAIDIALNTTQSTQTWSAKIDATPPNSFALLSPANNDWTGDSTPSFFWNPTTDDGVGLSKYQLIIDGNVIIDNINPNTTTISLQTAQALTEGNHNWKIKAYDVLGNARETIHWVLRVDLTPPNSFSLSSPSDNEFVNIPTPNFSWSSTTDASSGLSHYQLWIDDELNIDNLITPTTSPSVPISEGYHDWYIKAIDNVGNEKTTESWSVVGEWNSPLPFDLVSPMDGDTVITGKPLFCWQMAQDAGSGIEKYQLWLEGNIYKDNISASDTCYTPANDLPNGNYSWFVKTFDKANNETSSNSIWSIVVDANLSPQIIGLKDTAFVEDSSLVIYLDNYVTDDDSIHLLAWDIVLQNLDENLFIDYDTLFRHVTFSTQPDYYNFNIPIIFQVTDLFNGYDIDTMLLSILPKNDLPIISGLPDSLLLNADSSVTINMWEFVNDIETPDSLLGFEFNDSKKSLITNFNYSNGSLTLSTGLNVSDVTSLFISVSDDSNAVVTDSVKVTIFKPTSINNNYTDLIPNEYVLKQNYPNPFNPNTNIQYGIPKSSDVRIEIFNMLGQKIKTFIMHNQNAGYHVINFEANNLASGLYFYHMQAEQFSQVGKMLLMK